MITRNNYCLSDSLRRDIRSNTCNYALITSTYTQNRALTCGESYVRLPPEEALGERVSVGGAVDLIRRRPVHGGRHSQQRGQPGGLQTSEVICVLFGQGLGDIL